MGSKGRQRVPIRVVEIAQPEVDVEPRATRCRDEVPYLGWCRPLEFLLRGEVVELMNPVILLESNLALAPPHDQRDLVGTSDVVALHHS